MRGPRDPDAAGAIVVGVGSSHGDDQAGWLVIDRLANAAPMNVRLVKVQSPIEMLDLLPESSCLHLIDAAAGLDRPVIRLDLAQPDEKQSIQSARHRMTHDFSVQDALDLAQSLGIPTRQIVVWMIRAERFDPMASVRSETESAIRLCAESIEKELSDADMTRAKMDA